MKRSFHFAAAAALATLAFAPAAHAQTLTINQSITAVTHGFVFNAHSNQGRVTDVLTLPPVTVTANLSQYQTFVVHFSAPAGQEIVVNNPGVAYTGNFSAFLNPVSGALLTGGSVALSFDNLSGSVTLTGNSVNDIRGNSLMIEGFGGSVNASAAGAMAFTGYSLTFTGIPNLFNGTQTFTAPNTPGTTGTYASLANTTAARTDPGQFVFLRNIPPVPAPSSVVVALLGAVPLVGILRRRKRK